MKKMRSFLLCMWFFAWCSSAQAYTPQTYTDGEFLDICPLFSDQTGDGIFRMGVELDPIFDSMWSVKPFHFLRTIRENVENPQVDARCYQKVVFNKDEYDTKDARNRAEWGPAAQAVYLSPDRRQIAVHFWFDDESIGVLGREPSSIRAYGGEPRPMYLGLEVELHTSDNDLDVREITGTSCCADVDLLSMNPVVDTELFDSITNTGALRTIGQGLFRDTRGFKANPDQWKDKPYIVTFHLSEPASLDADYRVFFQLSVDLQRWTKHLGAGWDILDLDDYYGVETDRSHSFRFSGPGALGFCRTNKSTNAHEPKSCFATPAKVPYPEQSLPIEYPLAEIMGTGHVRLALSPPKEELLPDFVTEVKLRDANGAKKLSYTVAEKPKMHSYVENVGDADWHGDADDIYVRFYLSKGVNVDRHSDWIRVGEDEMKRENLERSDKPNHEEEGLDLPALYAKGHIEVGKTYNIVACADRHSDQDNGDGEVIEKHKSNNCSTEAVFSVVATESSQIDKKNPCWRRGLSNKECNAAIMTILDD